MAKLSKQTLQRLAVLRALLFWRRGAFGPMRVHKTLFFAEDEHKSERFFDFKKWHLGQFSEQIEELRDAVETKGYLVNEQILEEAHRHVSYTASSAGEIIAHSTIGDLVDIDMDSDDAESLSESVDQYFTRILKSQMAKACNQPFEAEDWRAIYFAGEEPVAK
jgi:hypothetical protein